MRDRQLAMQHVSPLYKTDVIQDKGQRQYRMTPTILQNLLERNTTSNCLRDCGFGFQFRVVLLLGCLPTMAIATRLPIAEFFFIQIFFFTSRSFATQDYKTQCVLLFRHRWEIYLYLFHMYQHTSECNKLGSRFLNPSRNPHSKHITLASIQRITNESECPTLG